MRNRIALALVASLALLATPSAVAADTYPSSASGDICRCGGSFPLKSGQVIRPVDKVNFTIDYETSRFEVYRNGVKIKYGVVVASKRTFSLYMTTSPNNMSESMQYFYSTTLPRLSRASETYDVVLVSKKKVRSAPIRLTPSDFPGRFGKVGFANGSAVLTATATHTLDKVVSTAKSSGLTKITVIGNYGSGEQNALAKERAAAVVAYLQPRLGSVNIIADTPDYPALADTGSESWSTYITTPLI